jgi:predicted metal-dependent hydrolase
MSMNDNNIIKQQIELSNRRIELLEKQNNLLIQEIHALREDLSKKSAEPLKTEIMRKFNRNKRNIIKSKILEIIGSSRNISIPEVKESVVDQMRYCSKATFYRYIDEMKKNNLLDFPSINGKEIVILSRQI